MEDSSRIKRSRKKPRAGGVKRIRATSPAKSKLFGTAEARHSLLDDALATGSVAYVVAAMNALIAIQGLSLTGLSKQTGIPAELLREELGVDGDPRLSTVLAVFKVLGFVLGWRPEEPARRHKSKTKP
jgi:DNA-binding phage protein